jgi:hypothetical protein
MRRAAAGPLFLLLGACHAATAHPAEEGSASTDARGTKLVRPPGALPATDAQGRKLFRPVDDRRCSELTTPRLVDQRTPLKVSREVFEQGVQGEFLYGCMITDRGDVTACKALEPVPFMNDAALAHVGSGRYDPARCDGKPVSVLYNFIVVLRFVPRER